MFTYVYYLIKVPLYLAVYRYLVMDTSQEVFSELNAKRFILYNILSDVTGVNSTNGPLGFRFTMPFGTWYNFMRPGTITSPLLPWVTAIRSIPLVLLYLLYLGLIIRALISPSISYYEIFPIVSTLALITPFDVLIVHASRGEHFVYMIVCMMFGD